MTLVPNASGDAGLSDRRSSAPAISPAESAAPSTSPRVLIVDDNQPTARALATLLNGANYRTTVAYRGSDALTYAGAGDFDAAVVDVHLPDISGLVVSQKLRERLGPGRPIVVLSGDTSMQTLNSLPHVGATYFFSKPVNAAYLLERLREWVDAGKNAAGDDTASGAA